MSGPTGLDELVTKIDRDGTRRAFAEQLEVSESYLSELLSGSKSFSRLPVAKMMKISALSGIPIERLMSGATAQAPVHKKRAARR